MFWPADAAQRHRLARYLMALGATGVVVAMFYVAAWTGFLAWHDAHVIAGLAVVFAAVFFAILRSGLNLRMPDPSLSYEMLVAALAVILYGVAAAGRDGRALLLMLVLPFVFAMFRFGTRALLVLSALVVGGYAAILQVQGELVGAGARGRESIAVLLILGLTLITFSLVGGTMATLRHELARGRRRLEAVLRQTEHLAMHDEVTGIYNRRYLEQRLSGEVRRARRDATLLSIGLLDLDHFKEVNERFGRAAGDAVLVAFAQCVGAVLREADCFGRWGGEEFIVLMPELALDEALASGERMRDALRALRVEELPPEFALTVSIGVASYRSGEAANVLLQRAGTALYRAKVAGRDRVESESRSSETRGEILT